METRFCPSFLPLRWWVLCPFQGVADGRPTLLPCSLGCVWARPRRLGTLPATMVIVPLVLLCRRVVLITPVLLVCRCIIIHWTTMFLAGVRGSPIVVDLVVLIAVLATARPPLLGVGADRPAQSWRPGRLLARAPPVRLQGPRELIGFCPLRAGPACPHPIHPFSHALRQWLGLL